MQATPTNDATPDAATPQHTQGDDGSHSQEQSDRIAALQRLMKEHFDPLPPQLVTLQRLLPYKAGDGEGRDPERFYCAAFLASREWDVQRAFAMMQEVVAYRAENQLDAQSQLPPAVSVRGWDSDVVSAALSRAPRPARSRIDRIVAGVAQTFSCGVHFWDKGGRPVVYVMIDSLDEAGLIAKLKENAKIGQKPVDVLWEYAQHFIGVGEELVLYQLLQQQQHQQEQQEQQQESAQEESEEYSEEAEVSPASVPPSPHQDASTAAAHGLITLVMDLKGLHMGLLWKPMLDLFRDFARELFKYYPDMVHRIIAVNAPSVVRVAFNMVKGVMPADFQKKITFVGAQHTLAALEEEIDSAHIPAFLGGSCQCAESSAGESEGRPGCCIDGYNREDPRGRRARRTTKRSKNAAADSAAEDDTANSAFHEGGDEAADDESGKDAMSEGGAVVPTEDVALSARQRHRRVFHLQPAETVVWEFALPSDVTDVTFKVYFVPQDQTPASVKDDADWAKVDVKKLEPHQIQESDQSNQADAFTATENGTAVLLWHNTCRWYKTRSVQLRVYKDGAPQQGSEVKG